MKLARVLASAALVVAFVGLAAPTAGADQGAGLSATIGRSAHAAVRPHDIGFNNCTADEQSTVETAAEEALDYVNETSAYLADLSGPTDRYTTWFGEYSADRKDVVENAFHRIGDSFHSVTYDCGHACANEQDTFAFVYPGDPSTIYLCGAFWNAPSTGTNSQAGTLVHEETHFTVNGGTVDDAYGPDACQQLAMTNPDEAVQNADNDEYFAENDPPLA